MHSARRRRRWLAIAGVAMIAALGAERSSEHAVTPMTPSEPTIALESGDTGAFESSPSAAEAPTRAQRPPAPDGPEPGPPERAAELPVSDPAIAEPPAPEPDWPEAVLAEPLRLTPDPFGATEGGYPPHPGPCRIEPGQPVPAVCDPGATYIFHTSRAPFTHAGSSYPVTVEGNTISVELDVRAGQSDFELITGWIRDYWEGSFAFLDTTYHIELHFTRLDNPFARAHVEVRHVRALDGGWCGDWSRSGGINADTLLRVAWADNCFDVQAVAAAHEFGHELGFRDAYERETCNPLHRQTEDIMTCAGSGRSVLGAHARILAEHYGDY